ncbi:MAG: META domain-containing protein [Chloroflexota bacterium]
MCNQFSGPYAVEPDGRITIGELAVTAMACADDDGTAQTQYLSALRASTGYQATDTRLQLTADDGTHLVYAPAPSASPSPSLPPG